MGSRDIFISYENGEKSIEKIRRIGLSARFSFSNRKFGENSGETGVYWWSRLLRVQSRFIELCGSTMQVTLPDDFVGKIKSSKGAEKSPQTYAKTLPIIQYKINRTETSNQNATEINA